MVDYYDVLGTALLLGGAYLIFNAIKNDDKKWKGEDVIANPKSLVKWGVSGVFLTFSIDILLSDFSQQSLSDQLISIFSFSVIVGVGLTLLFVAYRRQRRLALRTTRSDDTNHRDIEYPAFAKRLEKTGFIIVMLSFFLGFIAQDGYFEFAGSPFNSAFFWTPGVSVAGLALGVIGSVILRRKQNEVVEIRREESEDE